MIPRLGLVCFHLCLRRRSLATGRQGALLLTAAITAAACSSVAHPQADPQTTEKPPAVLSHVEADPPQASSVAVHRLERLQLGSAEAPFRSLAETKPTALRTPSGVIVPILEVLDDGYLVMTPCSRRIEIDGGDPIGRAHVVLDPGHGGHEPGAVGAAGAVEKDLNLQVSLRTKEILESRGATVVLTRETDYGLTLESRVTISNRVQPALFVSVHHNGGAPPGGDKPGTIVFTSTNSDEARRFGGLFFDALQPFLEQASIPKKQAWEEYQIAKAEYEAAATAYEEAVRVRGEIIEANRLASERYEQDLQRLHADPTAELSPPALIPEPDPPVQPQPLPEPAPLPFSWAGSGNAGVRSWTRSDGKDYLGVLRQRPEVPSALAEFIYVTNPAEEELLLDPVFVDGEAHVLADAITTYFSTDQTGSGFVKDQTGDQDIGGGGTQDGCLDPPLT